MALVGILAVLILGALISLPVRRIHKQLPWYVGIVAVLTAIIMSFSLGNASSGTEKWFARFTSSWIPAIGSNFSLAIDGLSYIMILLTLVMGLVAIGFSERRENSSSFIFNSLFMLAGVVGIFMATDLFLFFFFWEMMLLPLYFLIISANKEGSDKAAFKFLIYTQGSGLIMLISLLALYFIHGNQTAIYSFAFEDLLNTQMSITTSMLVMSGFLLAFLVKLPVWPLHGWLPSAFKTAPAIAIFSGLLIKTGAYGIMRFAVPLFPEGSLIISPLMMILGVVTILYASFIAFSQNDIRVISAYSGISHMGFILIGIYAFNDLSWQGVGVQMIASSVGTASLILLGEIIHRRAGTYDIAHLGGIWTSNPNIAGIGTFFAMAALGLPGMANFIAEFLILAGAFQISVLSTVLASIGIVAAAAYSLRIIQKVFIGEEKICISIIDVTLREKAAVAVMMVLLLWIGFYPSMVTSRLEPFITRTLNFSPPETPGTEQGNVDEAQVKYSFQVIKK
ncbi:MAG TPA: NADH-quinone oxidoreductase subunit M [Bacteroidales bacterium]|nr:NADH-quinone oxidoreductase subunit M [Bacteroidales bacterium]